MYLLHLWKQVKKKLRWKRRWLAFGILFAAAGLAALGWTHSFPGAALLKEKQIFSLAFAQEEPAVTSPVLKEIKEYKGTRETFKQTLYLCGEELQNLGTLSADEILSYHKAHPYAEVELGDHGQVYFTEKVNDLTTKCKDGAFFGLDEHGHLTLFNGLPQQEHAMRTFFQLNIDSLRSSLPKEMIQQLYDGIPVKDADEYNSVLSTFSEFALEGKQKP